MPPILKDSLESQAKIISLDGEIKKKRVPQQTLSKSDGGGSRAEAEQGEQKQPCTAIDFYNQTITGNVTKTLDASSTDYDHIPCVLHAKSANSGGQSRDSVICLHPKVTGTICASGAGTNRPAGQGNESDLCIVQAKSAGFMAGQGAKAGGIGYKEELSPTLKSVNSGGNTVPSVLTYGFCPDNSITAGSVAWEKEKISTLSTTKRMGVHHVLNDQVRRLIPMECGRLQGFPDWWCSDVPHSDTAEYKMWGNGMALPCVLYIMSNMVDTY